MDKNILLQTKATNGQTVEITLGEWTELFIDKAIIKHKDSCPATALDKRLAVVELHLKVIIYSLIPIYLWGVGYILQQIGKII